MVTFPLFIGFVLGALAVIGVEVLGVLFLIRKLSKKVNEEDVKITKSRSPEREELQFSFPNKQGWVWVLEKEKIPKTSPSTDKCLRQQKRKIEILEVSPVRKYASIKDQSLIVTEPDGTLTKISLLSCTVEAVSATDLPTRKWAKKYPVKVESKSSVIYHGSKLFYMYFETSCEKESWCKALRLASCDDREKLKWFDKMRSDFHDYLGSLNVEYPSFLKPTIGFNPEIGDRSIKIEGSSSKVRHFLKKLAKKTSKGGVENKTNWRSFSGREDKRVVGERSSGVQESSSVGGSSRASQTQKKSNFVEERFIQALTPRSSQSGSKSQGSISSDTDSMEKITSDDGTLCCNLLLSRLFFDAKSNVELRKSIQARIQRTLSTIRTPSYIGEIVCTGVDPGNIPPYIHGMRVLPTDLKEIVAMEIDIEYYGGAVLDIETRLEVQELENPENLGTNSDTKSVDEVKTDLLEGILKLNEQKNQAMEQKGDEIRKLEETKSFKGSEQVASAVSKWKSVLNSVAKQVSQVPLSLAIRVTTLRGTLRVHIKPPPSDQLWFGFTSMPDIDFSLESSVGDHKITSGHIALFIISKFKVAIRETMVHPNSESVTIPFMLAEKNDWVPQKTAPFIWTNLEVPTEPTAESVIVHEVHRAQSSSQEAHPLEIQEARISSARSTDSIQDNKLIDSLDDQKAVGENEIPLDESKIALLESEELQSIEENREEVTSSNHHHRQHPPPPLPLAVVAGLAAAAEENDMMEGEDDARLRRMGTKAKMLGKRMGEKLEEKRRNFGEKGRHFVEKMRGPGGI